MNCSFIRAVENTVDHQLLKVANEHSLGYLRIPRRSSLGRKGLSISFHRIVLSIFRLSPRASHQSGKRILPSLRPAWNPPSRCHIVSMLEHISALAQSISQQKSNLRRDTLTILDKSTMVVTSVMIGVELSVSLFINPAIWKRNDRSLRQ